MPSGSAALWAAIETSVGSDKPWDPQPAVTVSGVTKAEADRLEAKPRP